MNKRCGAYLGDNDGTCPQLTCIRSDGHPGPCDNVHGDHQVWGWSQDDAPVPVSFVYMHRNSAEIALAAARSHMPSFQLAVLSSDEVFAATPPGWGPVVYPTSPENRRRLSHEEAMELFRRLGW